MMSYGHSEGGEMETRWKERKKKTTVKDSLLLNIPHVSSTTRYLTNGFINDVLLFWKSRLVLE